MFSYYLIATVALAVFTISLLAIEKFFKTDENGKAWIFKGASLVLSLIFGIRLFGGKNVLTDTIGLNVNSPFGRDGQLLTALSVVFLWLTFTAHTLLTTYPFFKKKIRILTPLVKFFALPVYVADFIAVNTLIVAMGGVDALGNGWRLQGVFFAIEIGLSLSICIWTWVKEFRTNYE
jgi:hypothetical protein